MKIFPMRLAATILFRILLSSFPVVAAGQACPDGSDLGARSASILHGTISYHDELRQWIGLKLDHPACGQHEIQLVFDSSDGFRKAKALRRCSATAAGKLFEGLTGYYSADLAISGAKLDPASSCHPSPVEPDLSLESIPPVRKYYASITIDYRGKGHIDVSVWRDSVGRIPAKPWQAYVNYLLTGGEDVLWYGCRKGFAVDKIRQTPPNPNGNLEPDANLTGDAGADLDPDHINTIAFECHKQDHSESPN